jgi:hypothetical protein
LSISVNSASFKICAIITLLMYCAKSECS